ncbi:MAG: hypothetical protein PHF86_01085 [Candidatus Nanoarchaeia archaeon]|nr:hypothetical protein [Candidatus Nanoarchaeia archaeon]
MDRVIVTREMIGICMMQVCAITDATDEEILEVCNRENPSGTRVGWNSVIREIKENDLFRIKENLPVDCESFGNRKHFLILC